VATVPLATVPLLEKWFRSQGFGDCDGMEEQLVERVAIYGDVLSALHVARQPPGRGWLSKMGDGPDIEHAELSWIEGPWSGRLQLVLCRVVDAPPREELIVVREPPV